MLLSEKLMMKKWSPRLKEYYRTGYTDTWNSFRVYCGASRNVLIGTTVEAAGNNRKARFLDFRTFLWTTDLHVQNFSTTDSGSGDLVFYDAATVDTSTREYYVYKTTIDQANRTFTVDTTTISTSQLPLVTSGLLLDINIPVSTALGSTRGPISPGQPAVYDNYYSLYAGNSAIWTETELSVGAPATIRRSMVYNKIAADKAIGFIWPSGGTKQEAIITTAGYTATNFGDLDCANHLFYDNAFYYTKNNLVKKLNSSYASVWSVNVYDPLGNPMTPRLLGIYNNKAYVIGLPVDENQAYLGCMFYEISLSNGDVLHSCKFGSEFATSTERGAANVRAAMRTNYTYKPYVSQTGEFAIAVNYYDFIIADVS